MRWQHLGLAVATTLLIGPARAAESYADSRCANLASKNQPLIQILSATRVPGGEFHGAPDQVILVPASCRIVAVARPTRDSQIGFELWLPDGWNGRYAQLGNGGFAGNIDHPSLAAEIRRGNAAAMTDTGHKAGQFDASWALGHPEKVVDYGYRSIKVTADAARGLIGDYYGQEPRRRYFIGCSNGGRQALVAAQRYPADWDGIIAGSPALRWTEQLATFGAIQQRLRTKSESWIPVAKLSAISREALTTCGARALDCRLDVRPLTCAGNDGPQCLTPSQATTLALIQFNPLGFDPRFAVPQNWDQWILNPDRSAPSELTFATSAYRFLVYGRADWQIEQFNPAVDSSQAWNRLIRGQRLTDILDAKDSDLSPFANRGGKLIIYVGTADALISPRAGIGYYDEVEGRMGIGRTRSFARLFAVEGMQHCQGGIAPNAFGQAWVAPALKPDSRHDVRVALEAWVERGHAPDFLVAAMYSGVAARRAVTATRTVKAYEGRSLR